LGAPYLLNKIAENEGSFHPLAESRPLISDQASTPNRVVFGQCKSRDTARAKSRQLGVQFPNSQQFRFTEYDSSNADLLVVIANWKYLPFASPQSSVACPFPMQLLLSSSAQWASFVRDVPQFRLSPHAVTSKWAPYWGTQGPHRALVMHHYLPRQGLGSSKPKCGVKQ
jgi:hypothetical protein